MSPGAIIDGALAQANADTNAATIVTSPLTLNGVPARRSKAPAISGAVASHASSSMFKGPQRGKLKAKRWDSHLSAEAKAREPSTLKAAVKYLKDPNVISLGGGLPTSDYFPFESLNMDVPRPPDFLAEDTGNGADLIELETRKHDYRNGKGLYDIHIAFNYCQATGAPQLVRFVTEHTEIVHDPPYEDWECCLTCGSTSSLDMVLRMLSSRGDGILSEEYTFTSAVETGTPMGITTFGIAMDEQGLRADSMDKLLSEWDEAARGSPKPRVLYTVPSGQNPTGATQGLIRRREIYAVCQKHDVIIVEDEPYFFLQMDPYNPNAHAPKPSEGASHEEFLQALVPSYLSMDVDGRVLRLDSFSKVLSPGSRVGWITGAEQLIERYVRHSEVSTQNPSGISQLVLYKLLEEGWGHAGYLDWLKHLRAEYSRRRDVMVRACEDFLPPEVASWKPPMAGMFHWIKVDWRKHPRAQSQASSKKVDVQANGNGDSNGKHEFSAVEAKSETASQMLVVEEQVFLATVAEGAALSRGSWFRAEKDGGTDMFFRATFAAASEEQLREATKRFGTALRREFGI